MNPLIPIGAAVAAYELLKSDAPTATVLPGASAPPLVSAEGAPQAARAPALGVYGGGAIAAPLDADAMAAAAKAAADSQAQAQANFPPPSNVPVRRTKYSQVYNSAAGNAPSGLWDGVEINYGRIYAEVRSGTSVAPSGSFACVLVASQQGCHASVECDAGTTINGGSLVWWWFDPVDNVWTQSGVQEPLATGSRRAVSADYAFAVGAR